MIRRLKLPNVGICLDSGHVHCSGLDVATPIRTAGSHLLTTHLHDNLGGGDPRLPIPKTDLHLAVGLGTIHWPAVIRALDEGGYRGPAVIEGARLGPKDTAEQDWQRGVSMCSANWRAMEALSRSAPQTRLPERRMAPTNRGGWLMRWVRHAKPLQAKSCHYSATTSRAPKKKGLTSNRRKSLCCKGAGNRT